MKRDFTLETYQRICDLLDRLCPDKADRFGDAIDSFRKKWSGMVFARDVSCLTVVSNHFSLLAGLVRRLRTRIEEIFESVSELDDKYQSDMIGFGLAEKALYELQNCMAVMTALNESASEAAYRGLDIDEYFNPAVISETMYKSVSELKNKMVAVENGADFTADNFHEIPNSTKEWRIAEMEKAHPEYREKFEAVLSDPDLTEQQILDIKYMAYCAPEPYRTIYFEHIDRYRVDVYQKKLDEDGDEIIGAWYTWGAEISIYDRDDYFENDPRGPYNTFFHESGHAVDDYENTNEIYKSRYYQYNDRTIHDCLKEDTINYVNSVIDSDPELRKLTPKQRQALLRSVNLTDDADYSYGGSEPDDPVLLQAKQTLKDRMYEDLEGPENESPSDVIGGMTNNALIGDYGHHDDTYWYGGRQATHQQEAELWAEFYAAKMTHDEDALRRIRAHFPSAYEAMEHMAEDMAGEYGNTDPEGGSIHFAPGGDEGGGGSDGGRF